MTACRGSDVNGRVSANPDPVARVVIDAMGTRHELEQPARRVVSLVPSATETLRAIGASDALVGRTDYDTQAWAAGIPSVGGGLEPNLEALVSLRPDVVIRFGGEQDPRTPERLDDLGIRHVAVRPVALADLFETNRIVGEVVGREAESDALSHAIRAGLEGLAAATASLPRVRVAYVLGGSPPWVAGPGTYISQVLDLVGGDNVFSDLRAPYSAVSPEELRSRDVDVVIVSSAGSFDESLTPNARLEVVGDDFEVPGPGVIAAARRIAEVVHGRPIG
ncbi:MAG: helical backbone metal receptor [Gemmatimonadota bacterium]|nr:helical backbone metal receptor [Gemmatimonadota bacterium]